jgi:hypothetical protein
VPQPLRLQNPFSNQKWGIKTVRRGNQQAGKIITLPTPTFHAGQIFEDFETVEKCLKLTENGLHVLAPKAI